MLPKRIIISGASGSGKSTVINYLLEKYPEKFRLSVSHTTRKKREKETDHKEYHFISKEEFLRKIENNEMFEYQIFNNEYYGTSFAELNSCDKTTLFDLGKVGVEIARQNCISGIYISILCSHDLLLSNLIRRIGKENLNDKTLNDIYGRLEEYKRDESFFTGDLFDYKVFNISIDQLRKDVCNILNLELK